MPRALTVQRTLVTPPERKKFAFLEFCEAPDAQTLARAHASAPDRVLDPTRIYHEVELP